MSNNSLIHEWTGSKPKYYVKIPLDPIQLPDFVFLWKTYPEKLKKPNENHFISTKRTI